MEKRIFEKIKDNDIITIFGHVKPDGDCYGSQIGLKDAILATFPNKQVYVLGTGLPKFFKRISPMDEVGDELIKKSLAIVLDVANKERVEDQRFLMATFHYAEMLMNNGASLHGIYDILYEMDLNDIRFKGYVLSHFVTKEFVSYYKMTFEETNQLNVDTDYAASFVNLIADIKGYPIWCSFSQYEDGNIRVELRSKSIDYDVQQIAKKYGGGGHIQAAGAQVNSFEIVDKIIDDLILLAKGEFKNV